MSSSFSGFPNWLVFLRTGVHGGAPSHLPVALVGAFHLHILPGLSSVVSRTVPSSYVEALTPRISARDGVWRQGLHRGDEVTYEIIRAG